MGDGNHIPKVDYIGYIRKLEQTIITAVAEFGVRAKQVEGLTGVWVDEGQRLKVEYSSLNPQSPIPNLQSINWQQSGSKSMPVESRGTALR